MTMSTPIEIVREMQLWRRSQGKYDTPCTMPFGPIEFGHALDAVLADAERFKALERAHNHPGSPHYWWEPGVSVFTPLAELADRLKGTQ